MQFSVALKMNRTHHKGTRKAVEDFVRLYLVVSHFYLAPLFNHVCGNQHGKPCGD